MPVHQLWYVRIVYYIHAYGFAFPHTQHGPGEVPLYPIVLRM